jgi:hypothetical protein
MLKGARALVEGVLKTAPPPKTAVFCHLFTGTVTLVVKGRAAAS